jgi:hypothetical protein
MASNKNLKGTEVLESDSTVAETVLLLSSIGLNGMLFAECPSATLREQQNDVLEMTPTCYVSNSNGGDLYRDRIKESKHCQQEVVKLSTAVIILTTTILILAVIVFKNCVMEKYEGVATVPLMPQQLKYL